MRKIWSRFVAWLKGEDEELTSEFIAVRKAYYRRIL